MVDIPDMFEFDQVIDTGQVIHPLFKDELIFGSKHSLNLFENAKEPVKFFTDDGEGLPLFAFRKTDSLFKSYVDRVKYIFYQYQISEDGRIPETLDHRHVGRGDGFKLCKERFCDVAVRKEKYYLTSQKISDILDIYFGKEAGFKKYTLVKYSGHS